MPTKTQKVGIGTTFRYHHADSNPLWKVVGKRGRGCWLAEVQNEPFEIDGQLIDSDWAGTQKVFSTEEISACLRSEAFWDSLHQQHENFYNSLKVGQTIHYHHGFNEWVRCTVVKKDGKNVLKPVALVGEWRDYDLPRRYADGTVYLGYHAEQIAKGETFTPNASNLFEAGCKARNGVDPRTLQPLGLTVPPMTPEEEATANLWQKVKQVKEALEGDNPQAILNRVKELVA